MKTVLTASAFRVSRAIGLAICLTTALSVRAQQTADAAAAADDTNKKLMERIDQLETKVKQLEDKQATPAAAPAPVLAHEPAPAVEMPAVNEVAPRLKMIVFGDVGYQIYNGSDSTFFFGSFDMFMTARLSDKISALGEVLFLPDLANNSISVDIERLMLRYRQSDYFSASIGRYHTWVGYYNTAFNKGEFLETSTDRPFIYAFDDFGGILPLQDVGISVTGKIPSGKLGLNYVVELSNGREWGGNSEIVQNRQDVNTSKAVNGGLFMQPEAISGLQLGFSVRYDQLSIPGPAIHETIATAHGVFINSNYEILNEAVLVRHVHPGGSVFNTVGWYSQFSRRFGKYRPYFRYQYFNAPDDDPVYAFAGQNDYAPSTFTGFVGRLNAASVGIRWDFTKYSAVKLQYDRFSLRDLPSENGFTAQFAFTF